jgi:plastocyanin
VLGALTSRRPHRQRKPKVRRRPGLEYLENRGLLTTVTVDVINFAFSPSTVSIHVGDTVEWVWQTDDHSTTSVAGSAVSWDSGVHNTGFTFSQAFNQAGTFNYYCKIHGFDNGNGTAGGMSGTVDVLAPATLSSITVMPANPTIAPNGSEQFMAVGTMSDNSTEDLTGQVTWSSSNTSVATVSNATGSQGLATGLAQGTSTISASFDGLSGSTQLTVAVAPPPPPPLITMTNVQFVRNKRHLVTQVTIDFSGAVNAVQADSVGTYRLAMAGKKGSFTAKNSKVITLNSAVYNASNNELTLTPRKPFALKKPVQVQVNGLPPSGLEDSDGRLIDGNHDGVAGGNAVAVLRSKGVTLSAVVATPAGEAPTFQAIAALTADTQGMMDAAPSAGSAHSKHKSGPNS